MSVSEDELTKKINNMKSLASRRIDEILKARSVKQHNMKSHFTIKSIFDWLRIKT